MKKSCHLLHEMRQSNMILHRNDFRIYFFFSENSEKLVYFSTKGKKMPTKNDLIGERKTKPLFDEHAIQSFSPDFAKSIEQSCPRNRLIWFRIENRFIHLIVLRQKKNKNYHDAIVSTRWRARRKLSVDGEKMISVKFWPKCQGQKQENFTVAKQRKANRYFDLIKLNAKLYEFGKNKRVISFSATENTKKGSTKVTGINCCVCLPEFISFCVFDLAWPRSSATKRFIIW